MVVPFIGCAGHERARGATVEPDGVQKSMDFTENAIDFCCSQRCTLQKARNTTPHVVNLTAKVMGSEMVSLTKREHLCY